MNGFDSLRDLPGPVLAVIAVAACVQVVLAVWSLIRLERDKSPQIGGVSRWGWLVIILFGNLIGAAVFLFVHRREVRGRAAVAAAEPGASEGRSIADVIGDLYREGTR